MGGFGGGGRLIEKVCVCVCALILSLNIWGVGTSNLVNSTICISLESPTNARKALVSATPEN